MVGEEHTSPAAHTGPWGWYHLTSGTPHMPCLALLTPCPSAMNSEFPIQTVFSIALWHCVIPPPGVLFSH